METCRRLNKLPAIFTGDPIAAKKAGFRIIGFAGDIPYVRTAMATRLGRVDPRPTGVSAGNAGEGCSRAADNPAAAGQVYNCSNDGELTQRQYFELVAAAAGAKPVTRRVPFKVAYGAAFVR